ITERWNPGGGSEDDNLGWATDAQVLTFNPFNLVLRHKDLPLRETPRGELKLEVGRKQPAAAAPGEGSTWDRAPRSPPECFVGRENLLKAITADWRHPTRRVTGLVGPAGVGKTSVARSWLDQLLVDSSLPHPTKCFGGVFRSGLTWTCSLRMQCRLCWAKGLKPHSTNPSRPRPNS